MSSLRVAQRATRVLVAGGSYAGLAMTLNLLDLCHGFSPRFSGTNAPADKTQQAPVEVTIVDQRDGFYHLIGTPLAYTSREYAEKAWIRFQDIPALQTPSVKIINAGITQLNCQEKVATVTEISNQQDTKIPYDYFVAASGLRRTKPSAPTALSRKEYLNDALEHIRLVESAEDGVVVIGAGAVGIEIAAELKTTHPHLKVTLIHSRKQILSSENVSDEFRDLALGLVQESGVETILGARVNKVIKKSDPGTGLTSYEVCFVDGRHVKAGFVVNAISKFHPTANYLPSSALDEEGYVKIGSSTAFVEGTPNADYHYAAGDIARWPGIKRCGAAMHQGLHTAVNIHQRILSAQNGITPQFKELDPNVPPMMALAIGKKAASYTPDEGIASGEDVLNLFFGDDLGFAICWNYLRLGEAPYKGERLIDLGDADVRNDTQLPELPTNEPIQA
ncbi:pyridine nucleotide-disulphide oxidoreductase AMID-like, putative [Talaromyces stipitatus ATCC 10500]|uniref:Pyridine nucleotide-disulphide oxidoreductase AMID-like, putative n=1 Tax=Talaromyces stipitatus (strain ATCC 10500 / CBS 375.48 / QM 6759 / NRRL 1006) TaxID=441959 RepID=B8MJ68_TALSN|nr:pyridine nucleotide-disulfide oxidoreductase AMID-like, putative [Talaromyces stipitatus ATCC 10500]EED14657.1 pyridine nucleotide-disulphide oxidoreductase AMID-like, putative [Talaromyces stipitatus ATCC 10500]